jgi:hypothetical protein
MTFEIQVTADAGATILLSRQTVSSATTGSISDAVGKTLTLNVWSTNAAGTTLASSAPFGPVIPAGDTFIIAFAFLQAGQSLPSAPYPFIGITGGNTDTANVNQGVTTLSAGNGRYPISNPNPGMSGLGFGSNGGGGMIISSSTFGDVRLKGRLGQSIGITGWNMRIDIPDSAVDDIYRVYIGLGASGTIANTNFGIFRNGTSTSVYQSPVISDGDTSISVVDASGVVRTVSAWQTSVVGNGIQMGNFLEVTIPSGSGRYLTLGRSTTASAAATQISCFALFKKAS